MLAAALLAIALVVSSDVLHQLLLRLVDMGDGVLRVDFHSKMNAIGADTIQMLRGRLATAMASGDSGVHLHMMIATALGAGLTVLLAGALMTLAFLSSSSGHDDQAKGSRSKDDL